MESIQEFTANLATRLNGLSKKISFDQKTSLAKEFKVSQAGLYRICSGDVKKIEKKLTLAESIAVAMEKLLEPKPEPADA